MMGMPAATVNVSGCLYQYRLLGRPGGPNTRRFYGTMLLRGGLCEIEFATNAGPICKIIVNRSIQRVSILLSGMTGLASIFSITLDRGAFWSKCTMAVTASPQTTRRVYSALFREV
jgi:hypothetical protein